MVALVQRVSEAQVTVDNIITGKIKKGLIVYLGVHSDDTEKDITYIARKLCGLRIFPDREGKMNLSVSDQTMPEILLIPQFTLLAETKKGQRPFFGNAAQPEKAEPFFNKMKDILSGSGINTESGVFRTHMKVSYTNDGPVTIILNSHD